MSKSGESELAGIYIDECFSRNTPNNKISTQFW